MPSTTLPKFIDKYYVYGIARRGFGDSSYPTPNDRNYFCFCDRLGDDVLAVIARGRPVPPQSRTSSLTPGIEFQARPPRDRTQALDANQPRNLVMNRETSQEFPNIEYDA